VSAEAGAREAFATAILQMDGEAEQRAAIAQMLIDLMDVTEQSDTGDMVIAAYNAFEGTRPSAPPPAPPPEPPAASLPPEQQAICQVRFAIELLANYASNVWIDAGPTSPETSFLGLRRKDYVPLITAHQAGMRTIKMVVAGDQHVEVIGAGVEAARRK
jgi:hypothetical protein